MKHDCSKPAQLHLTHLTHLTHFYSLSVEVNQTSENAEQSDRFSF